MTLLKATTYARKNARKDPGSWWVVYLDRESEDPDEYAICSLNWYQSREGEAYIEDRDVIAVLSDESEEWYDESHEDDYDDNPHPDDPFTGDGELGLAGDEF